MLSRNVIYFGKDKDLSEQIELFAGPLSLYYQDGDLRNICFNGKEIVRRIYGAIRDRNWGTIPNVITNECIHVNSDTFNISYDVSNRRGSIAFFWHANIEGTQQGQITFTFIGEAQDTFLTCRIGFCVLHPLDTCMGKVCTVERDSGEIIEGKFPYYIAPAEIPPFLDMRGMYYEGLSGEKINLHFDGDLFEMEDQRNWTDASFKTFCTPLRLECPREIKKGTKIKQSVTVNVKLPLHEKIVKKTVSTKEEVQISVGTLSLGKLPSIGLCTSSIGLPLTPKEIERLKLMHLGHLRLDLIPTRNGYVSKLFQAVQAANALNIPLEIALYLNDAEKEIMELSGVLEKVPIKVSRWMVFQDGNVVTPPELVRLTRRYLGGYDSIAMIGGGSNADFYELNKGRPSFEGFDFVCYSINPQVHTFDNDTLIENLETQAMTVESARQFAEGRAIVVSPITLRQRFNPVADSFDEPTTLGELPPQVDNRQMSLLGAVWTAGSINRLIGSGVTSVTYFETTGWRGVMEIEKGSPYSEKILSIPGGVFPLFHVLADVGEFSGGELISTKTTDHKKVIGFSIIKNSFTRLIVANLTPYVQKVSIHGFSNISYLQKMDEMNAFEAMRDPENFRNQEKYFTHAKEKIYKFELLPYALLRLDGNVE